MTGSSFADVLRSADTPPSHTDQYYEIHGHRGYYRQGWEAVTLHYAEASYDDERWHLFNVERDPAQTTDLAAHHPELVAELVGAWDEAAWSNFVYPLGDHGEHMRAVMTARTEEQAVTLIPGAPSLEWSSAARLIHGRSFQVTVSLEHHAGDRGVLFSHGDQGGGYSVYIDDDGSCVFAHNAYGDMSLVSGGTLPDGTTEVTLDVTLEAHARWSIHLAADGKQMATASDLEALGPMAPFEGIDVGMDRRSPVSWDVYQRHGTFPYSGTIRKVVYRPEAFGVGTSQRASERDVAEDKFQ
jgi:arylsulfatase